MNDLRDFSQVKTSELLVTRQKWMFPYYELTDGQFIYARMRYKGSWKRYAIIETADNLWTIKRKGLLSRVLYLNQGEDQTIGNITPGNWKRDIVLQMDNGFEGTYHYKKLLSRALVFNNVKYGDFLQIIQKPFGFRTPFEVKIDPSMLKNAPQVPIPLLAFIGINVILMRQAQAAAAS